MLMAYVRATKGEEIYFGKNDHRNFLRQGSNNNNISTMHDTTIATRKMQEKEITCILITTSTNPGYLNVLVDTNDGNGFVEVTTPDILYEQSEVVLDECYSNLVGVQVTNSRMDGWSGSVEYSLNDKSSPYLPMICLDCTGPVDTTELLVVDGDDTSSGDTKCLDGIAGNTCTLVARLPNMLVIVGDNGVPSSAFPLQECEGDCDNDDDCDLDLICQLRDDVEEVPGCIGNGSPGKDYCRSLTSKPTPTPTSQPSPNPTRFPSKAPITSKPTDSPTPGPTISPSANPTASPSSKVSKI